MAADQHPDVRAAKQHLRRTAQRRRGAMPPELRRIFSALAIARLTTLHCYRRASLVMAFASFGDEIDTQPLLRQIIADGKLLILPAVVPKQRDLALRLVPDLALLVAGKWGIMEPPRGAATVGPGDLDLVVAPGLAFDLRGFRVGYGGGYYDRLLRRVHGRPGSTAVACGLGFEAQVWPVVPTGDRDESLDCLVTEAVTRHFA